MLVIDAGIALRASAAINGFNELGGEQLVAPPLMWSEARSVLHELAWRREVEAADAIATRDRLDRCPVERREHAQLAWAAWRLADELGWAQTYDAEYVALAFLLGCRLLTLDSRLHRGAARLGFVISPAEL
ncbi:hypothetical protein BH18CHL2_BH18CHL2_08120 [soil metagenome]